MRLSAENFYLQDQDKGEVVLRGSKLRLAFHEESVQLKFVPNEKNAPGFTILHSEAIDIINVLKWCRRNNIAPSVTYICNTSEIRVSVLDDEGKEHIITYNDVQDEIGIMTRNENGYPLLITEKNIIDYIEENINVDDIRVFRDRDLGHWLLVFRPEVRITEIPFYAVPYILGSLNIGANYDILVERIMKYKEQNL